MSSPLLIVIAGPTASGKTRLAIDIAKHFDTEIISADSRQCYREMNIGVAKPSEEELATVKHHFINSHSIHDEVNAGVYERYASETLNNIFRKKKIAVLTGGTGMYIDALLNGIDNMPEIDEKIRNNIRQNFELYGMEWLQAELKQKDTETFSSIDRDNPHRLMRALEVITQTGKSITSFQNKTAVQRNFSTVKIALDWDREVLYKRLNKRVDIMMAEGLLDEVKTLYPHRNLKALQTVGYKELFAHLNGECSLEFAIEEIKKNTRRYAKRQITWFKNQDTFTWMSPWEQERILDYIKFQFTI